MSTCSLRRLIYHLRPTHLSPPRAASPVVLPRPSSRSITTNTDEFVTAPPPPRHDRYQATIKNLDVREGSKVGVVGVIGNAENKARQEGSITERYLIQAKSLGTNIIATSGTTSGSNDGMKAYPSMRELNADALPFCLTLLPSSESSSSSPSPDSNASSPMLQAVRTAIEEKVPLIAAVSNGEDTETISEELLSSLTSQSITRLLGPSPTTTLILPHVGVHLGAPLPSSIGDLKAGKVGVVLSGSSSGTEAGLTLEEVLNGVNGESFGVSALFVAYEPGTRAWEIVEWLFGDDSTKVILLEPPTSPEQVSLLAASIRHYRSSRPENQKPKPIIALEFDAGGMKSEASQSELGELGVKFVEIAHLDGALRHSLGR